MFNKGIPTLLLQISIGVKVLLQPLSPLSVDQLGSSWQVEVALRVVESESGTAENRILNFEIDFLA